MTLLIAMETDLFLFMSLVQEVVCLLIPIILFYLLFSLLIYYY